MRDEHGKPLTVLQLAKDTWDKAKSTHKSKQIDYLMSVWKVDSGSCINLADVMEQINVEAEYNW